jgi:oxaloacetate decarboxylase alpha subunit
MTAAAKPLRLTELVLRDAHQSLFATRMRIDDMLPIAEKLDTMGYWSVETWGGATYDSCIRFLGEDPWERIRELKKVMPRTPHQMLLRGQNLIGYRHYADDVVEKFVERAAINGVDVFRVFDALNDVRNIEVAMKAVRKQGKHAQGTICFTTSPVHTLSNWIDQGRRIEDMGADSICLKDMAGLISPFQAHDIVKALKSALSIPVHMHCHATTGQSTAAIVKAVEAGVDGVDTAISSMSHTYGHSATESVVAIFRDTPWATGLDMGALEQVAAYFREVRPKYAAFEGSLKGIDSRILVAQVPGGMLTNMESQLKQQKAEHRFDEVLAEIPRVRKDLGYLPLVTPTSQIVGTQAVMNVVLGERYKVIAQEVQGILRGEYGALPAPCDAELQARVLNGKEPVTCRPADLLKPEMDRLSTELGDLAAKDGITLAAGERRVDDVLTYALFPQVGLKFLKNRGNPAAFEPAPTGAPAPGAATAAKPKAAANGRLGAYRLVIDGKSSAVEVYEGAAG